MLTPTAIARRKPKTTTVRHLVTRYFPRSVGTQEALFILWEMTAYPMCGLEHTKRQLRELAQKVRAGRPGWRQRLGAESARIYEEMGID